MIDPLAEVVTSLQPIARFSKLVEGAGAWRIRRPGSGQPFYCAILEGACRMKVGDEAPLLLQAGDFLLVPAMRTLVSESLQELEGDSASDPVRLDDGHFRAGIQDGPPTLRMRVGYCSFGSPDAALLVQLLPQVVHVQSEPRLAILLQLVSEETSAHRLARELVLERLMEVLLLEALRCGTDVIASPGLAQGLADVHLAAALRAFHASPNRVWTIKELANEAALSRSAFFTRFNRTMGLAPMAYILGWRMALAKRLLREQALDIAQVAEKVGYSSASTFSVAFMRHVGISPARYGRDG